VGAHRWWVHPGLQENYCRWREVGELIGVGGGGLAARVMTVTCTVSLPGGLVAMI
jgi:hypothetical protein